MTPVRYWFEMAARTVDALALTRPEGMRGRTYASAYETARYAAHCEAFRDHWGCGERSFEARTTLSVRSESLLPELSRLAFDGDELSRGGRGRGGGVPTPAAYAAGPLNRHS